MVITFGSVYHITASRMELLVDTPIQLPVALKTIPFEIGNWVGRDVPIDSNIQRIAANDDFLNRLYINQITKDQVNVYIAYSARPRTMVGHKPERCYTGSGWILKSKESSVFTSGSGVVIPCLVHHFYKPVPEHAEIVVLNYYILNGTITSDESNFSGLGWRTPNVAGNPARYVAQVQISSVLENSVRLGAADMVNLILEYVPDENGIVRAASER